jgi:transcriptional regulator with XRE-family HTH domain
VDAKNEIREFLTSRRGRLTPEQTGLASYGPRRVPGLRREEVAVLAGVSVPYYTRLERGDMHGVSDTALDAGINFVDNSFANPALDPPARRR